MLCAAFGGKGDRDGFLEEVGPLQGVLRPRLALPHYARHLSKKSDCFPPPSEAKVGLRAHSFIQKIFVGSDRLSKVSCSENVTRSGRQGLLLSCLLIALSPELGTWYSLNKYMLTE